jgi:hypothetical protein
MTGMAEAKFPYQLSDHAAEAMRERGIALAWVARVVENPSRTEPDRLDPNATHAMAAIPEFDDRVLRVIYNGTVSP